VRFVLIVVLLPGIGLMVEDTAAVQRFGGMSLREAFLDERVARLIEAALEGDFTRADAQLQAGADPNYVGTDGILPLMWVMMTEYRKRTHPGTEYMLRAGASPNLRSAKGYSAMYFAAGGDNPAVLELLLRLGGDPATLNEHNETMLFTAVGEFRKENIELLLRHGADLNFRLSNGDTVANFTARMGRFDWVAMFLERGLSYNLEGLAKSVVNRTVSNRDGQRDWQDKVISMLKARGVEVPSPVPYSRPAWFETLKEMEREKRGK